MNRLSSFWLLGTGASGGVSFASLARSMAACDGFIGGPARPQADRTAAAATIVTTIIPNFFVNAVAISTYRPALTMEWCFISRFLADTTRKKRSSQSLLPILDPVPHTVGRCSAKTGAAGNTGLNSQNLIDRISDVTVKPLQFGKR